MKQLFISIKTISENNLSCTGVYRHAEGRFFNVTAITYIADNEPVKVINCLRGEKLPDRIRQAIRDNRVSKIAYDAGYTRVCLSRYIGLPAGSYLCPVNWYCVKSKAMYLGMPDDPLKLARLLRHHVNAGEYLVDLLESRCYRHIFLDMPREIDRDWPVYSECLKAEADTIRQLWNALGMYEMPENEYKFYVFTQVMNDRGIMTDTGFVHEVREFEKAALPARLRNSSSDACLGCKSESSHDDKDICREERQARLSINRASDKYIKLENSTSGDGRLRGQFRYYGARAGRSGNGTVQLDNLPVSHLSNLSGARKTIASGYFRGLKDTVRRIPESLSELFTTAFIPGKGCALFVNRFDALENCVLFWITNGNPEGFVDAVIQTLSACASSGSAKLGKLVFSINDNHLSVKLPSGRQLFYCLSELEKDGTASCFRYDSHHRWTVKKLTGKDLAGDIVRGIARDLIMYSAWRLERNGYKVVMITPCRIVAECPEDITALECHEYFAAIPAWAKGMELIAVSYKCESFLEISDDTERKD